MSLRFKCQNCGNIITVKYLKIGDTCKCPICNWDTIIIENAESMEDNSTELVPFGGQKYNDDKSSEQTKFQPGLKSIAGIPTVDIEERKTNRRPFYFKYQMVLYNRVIFLGQFLFYII